MKNQTSLIVVMVFAILSTIFNIAGPKILAKSITISKGEKTVDVTRLMAVMGLCVKCGQDVQVEIDGADEEAAFEGMKAFFVENL